MLQSLLINNLLERAKNHYSTLAPHIKDRVSRENVVQQEQNNQLKQDNKLIKVDSDKKDKSADIDNQTSEDTNNKKKENDKEFSVIIKSKNKDLNKISLPKKISDNKEKPNEINNTKEPEVSIEDIIRQRSFIRIDKIQQAYCATQKTCIQ